MATGEKAYRQASFFDEDYKTATIPHFFDGVTTMDTLRKEYKRLVKLYHPDLGGDETTMKALNNAYDAAVIKFNAADDGDSIAIAAEFKNVVSSIIIYDDLAVELVGRWIWVSGNTFIHKEALKAAGFKWAGKKKAWYWHGPDDGVAHGSKKSLDQSKAQYGSIKMGRDDSQKSLND